MKNWILACSAAVWATALQAQWAGEFLIPSPELGFVLASDAPTAPAPMREYVPRDETVERWTRMITVLRWPYRPGLTPGTVVGRLSEAFVASCSGATATAVQIGETGGRADARVRVDCPRNAETGLPETMFARALLGDEAIEMVQAATRRVPSLGDERWAEQVLAGVIVCGEATPNRRCVVARKAKVGSALD